MKNELYHHGIIGQRWGVRRYQNKDGSLTNAGRERYLGNIDKSKLDYTEYDEAYKKCKTYSEMLVNKHSKEQEKRIDDAADTALRAMNRDGDYDIGITGDYNTESEDTKRSVKEWLTYEDQTIGYVEIADLANQGKNGDQIRKILDDVSKNFNKMKDVGREIVNQVENIYLSELSMPITYEDRDYIEDQVFNAVNNTEALWDLDYLWSNDYYRSKMGSYIDSCVIEASKKKKK